MTRRQLYFLALFLGLAGQIWIVYSYQKIGRQEEAFNTCLFKRVTGMPCPSCGTIHSIVAIFHRDLKKALEENPLGFPGLLMVAVVPYWVLADLILGRESFYRFFLRLNAFLNRKAVLYTLLFTVFLIWAYKLGIFFHLLP